jgi:hypothetical protein
MDSGILMIQDSILVCSPDPRIPHTANCGSFATGLQLVISYKVARLPSSQFLSSTMDRIGCRLDYVVLSCVQTMKGLYLAALLSKNLSKYAMSTTMRVMIDNFQQHLGLELYTEAQYDNKIHN